MKKCKYCQSDIADNAKKCSKCSGDQRNWFVRHKVLSVIIALVVLGLFSAAAGGNKSTNGKTGTGNSTVAKTYRFNDRADKQVKDIEIIPGESGTVDAMKLTVVSIEKQASLSEYQTAPSGKVYLVANITIENTADRAKPYNIYDFRLQTSGGQVLDPSGFGSNELGSGDLVQGGKVTGKVAFEVPIETAAQYIIYKPNPYESDRVIVQVK
jgi:hypothetical protein